MEVFPTVSSCESARHLLHLWVGLLLPLNGPALKPRLPRPGYLAWEGGGGCRWGVGLLVRQLSRTLGLSFSSVVRICGLESQCGTDARFGEDWLPSTSSMESERPAVNPFLHSIQRKDVLLARWHLPSLLCGPLSLLCFLCSHAGVDSHGD